MSNPFLITGYVSPEYFCDREKETQKILSAIDNGRNITLLSLRRIGKTGLIKHVFHHLTEENRYRLLYLDIMATSDTSGFIREFGEAIVKDEQKYSNNFLKKLTGFLSGIRAKLTFNEITGVPEIELDYAKTQNSESSIAAIFDYLSRQEASYVIAIDEFQQIVNYPEKNLEALLRSYVQQNPNIRFIFSGSNKHLLLSMFSNYGRPFYQSGEIMHLDRLNPEIYAGFIIDKFQENNRKINSELVLEVLNKFDTYTFYVQFLFNRLFETGSEIISKKLVYKVLDEILAEREYMYYNYRNLLTNNQFQLLKAIAKESGVTQYSSKEFIGKYKLGTSSSVNRSLRTLLDKEMIYEEFGMYKVYDLFFANWLTKK